MPARDEESATAIAVIDPLVGTIFDKRFRIDEKIAAGGFGAIYRATHVKSGHQIALKVLLPTLAQDLGIVARFRREGDTMTALRSPHTITAYELGQAPDRTLFIVMELLHGKSLFDHYETHGPFEWKRMVRIARQVCDSLAEAHALGIVHRDLKPTNIHLETKDGDPDFVKVLDFGIAKILQGSDFDSADITNAGTMIGTLDYMSPEQMVGGGITGQTDIYTLGIVMYEMIAGTRPFPEAATAASALASMLKSTPQQLYLRAPVPEELNRIVMRCLEKDAAKRYRRIEDLAADLDRLTGATSDSTDSTIDKTRTLAVDTHKYDKQDDNESTRITPPPERVLDALRTPKVQMLADPARAPKVEKRAASDWGDDDDSVDATVAVQRPAARDSVMPTVAVPRSDPRVDSEDDEQDETLSGRSGARAEANVIIAPSRPNARAGSVDATIAMQRTSADRAPTRRADETPGAVEVDTQPRRRFDVDPEARTEPAPLVGRFPTPRPLARSLQTPVPSIVAAPFSSTPRTPVPQPSPLPQGEPPMRASPFAPQLPPPPRGQFDVSKAVARDQMIRRLIWSIVIVVGVSVGILIAALLR